MRYILVLALAALCGYGVFQIGELDPDNYVKMYIGQYVVEIKVLGFLLAVLALVIVLYFIIRLFRMLWKAPASYGKWRDRHKTASADAALGTGYLALIKGDWKYAEKQLTSKTDNSSLPYINYLAAAQAAQEQGKIDQRDAYLNAAYKAAPKERLAIGLTKTRLHQAAGQHDQALTTLEDIADIGRKNPQFTAMLMQTYQQTGNWQGVQNLLGVARKQNALPADVLDGADNEACTSVLSRASDKQAAWKAMSKEQRKQAANVLIYANDLLEKGDVNAAEKVIRVALKSTWSPELVRLYGTLSTDKPAKLRRVVEGWLLARPESDELNLAAGRFAILEKNYEAAKEYLQKAIHFGQLPSAYALLGEVFEASNDSGKALQLYRAGIANLSTGKQAELLENSASDAHAEGELIVAEQKTAS